MTLAKTIAWGSHATSATKKVSEREEKARKKTPNKEKNKIKADVCRNVLARTKTPSSASGRMEERAV